MQISFMRKAKAAPPHVAKVQAWLHQTRLQLPTRAVPGRRPPARVQSAPTPAAPRARVIDSVIGASGAPSVLPLSPLRPLTLVELLDIRKSILHDAGLMATNGLRLSVATGSFVALGASLVMTLAATWIPIAGLGAIVFASILAVSIVVGLIAQKIARKRRLGKMADDPDHIRAMTRVQLTVNALQEVGRGQLTGDQATRLCLAKRMLDDMRWDTREKIRQAVCGYFGRGDLLDSFTQAIRHTER